METGGTAFSDSRPLLNRNVLFCSHPPRERPASFPCPVERNVNRTQRSISLWRKEGMGGATRTSTISSLRASALIRR